MPNELKDQNNSGYSGHAGGGYGYGGGGGGSGGSGQYNNSGGYTGYSRPGQPGGYGSPPPQVHYQQTGVPRFYGPIARPIPNPVSYPPEQVTAVEPVHDALWHAIHDPPLGGRPSSYPGAGQPLHEYNPYGTLSPGNDGSYYPGGPPGYKSDARGGDSIGHTTISKNNLGGGPGSTPDPGQNQNQMAPMSQVNSPGGSAPNIRMLLARSLMAPHGAFGGFGK